MTRIRKNLVTALALAIGLAAWGCEQATEPASQAPQIEVGAQDELLGGLITTVTTTLTEDDLWELAEAIPIDDVLAAEDLLELGDLESVVNTVSNLANNLVSTVIGTAGGVLKLNGHVLTVPSGAVLAPTRFTMRAVPNGGVEVDLKAVQPETGNIGSSGFEIPVRLALSYAGTDEDDPSDLVIVRVATGEALDTHVSTDGSTVWADLDHFSRYRLCTN